MPKFFSKITKICLWVFVSTLFISGTKLEQQELASTFVDVDYLMQVTGNLSSDLSGVMNFETAIETASKGTQFTILKLKLDNVNGTVPHSMQFLISKENSKELLPTGTYKIAENHEGFLNYFDGVFGFANINALGELPLFAKSGEIQIDRLDGHMVKGKLNITLKNTVGKSVQIQGKFIAEK